MTLGSDRGIASEFGLASLDDVMKLTPFNHTFEGVAGNSRDSLSVDLVLSDGTGYALDSHCEFEHACNYDPTEVREAAPIGEQVTGSFEGVVALEFHRRKFNCNSSPDEEDDYREVLYITPPDYGKMRRRVEDCLRKLSDPQKIFRIAVELGVKLY